MSSATSLSLVYSRANQGVNAPLVTVECHLSNGLPAMSLVGLPETAVKESRERVRSAIINAGFAFPERRITINLAPAGIPKSGGRYDLAIALGLLAADGQIDPAVLLDYEILGELSLSGGIRSVTGVVPALLAARDHGRQLILPAANQAEARLVRGAVSYSAETLGQALSHFKRTGTGISANTFERPDKAQRSLASLTSVRGQEAAKWALTLAAAGGHNLLFCGSPGSGKTLLAQSLPELLPDLSEQETLLLASIRSVSSKVAPDTFWQSPPFRAPHHSSTGVSLIGGGKQFKPGEISLAHGGVLFLDELPEFSHQVLENLREPLESGTVSISRADYRVQFPAAFQLVAAMNPCPCGYYKDENRACCCPPDRVRRYQACVSGPLLDRIDLHVRVQRPALEALFPGDNNTGFTEPDWQRVKQHVAQCRARQMSRNQCLNARMSVQQVHRYCVLSKPQQQLIKEIAGKWQLTARGCHRLLKIARTLADWSGMENIADEHLIEASQYRQNLAVTEGVTDPPVV
ncbi:YifB family Mg chelatase-like AAA ATPase [Pseudohongiella nitratireducens]|uniref:YifB family Mg chelatase-like AAA ATPase n=1 Tax=Pseudohongiella nitratireducens TaxID=1768907 RepID=UPI0030ED1466|tara:strand:- start:1163 stop:2722 length:1560 start_codon:yes stop_codon:yes gene_type:complete